MININRVSFIDGTDNFQSTKQIRRFQETHGLNMSFSFYSFMAFKPQLVPFCRAETNVQHYYLFV